MTAELVNPTSTVTKPATTAETEKSLATDMGGRRLFFYVKQIQIFTTEARRTQRGQEKPHMEADVLRHLQSYWAAPFPFFVASVSSVPLW